MSAVELREVTARFGDRTVLDAVDLQVKAGEWVALIGPNGAGKTTLLRAITGQVKHEGSAHVLGQPVASLDARALAKRVALVPQNPVVPPGMPVADYVLLGRTPHLGPFAIEGPQDVQIVADLLDRLDLHGFGARHLDTLSGGELQRAVLARALAQQAPVLLLDEPTSALDIGHQQQVLELVDQLRREDGLTVLSAMHDLNLAGQHADRLLLLSAGRVVVDGPPAEVLTAEHLAEHYGARVRILHDECGGVVIVPLRSRDNVHVEPTR
ncbi:MAG: iron complex transport system ATP-binding protein [Glaciecola sp.]|jgi:iron complex transport system ATP-binding protein